MPRTYGLDFWKVSLRKKRGQIPKFTKKATIAIGSIPKLSAMSTIRGAIRAPYKAKASMIPMAVD
jgi:hypothetical protein